MAERSKRPDEATGSPDRTRGELEFRGIQSVPRGTVLGLLAESYMGWPDREGHLDDWRSVDREFFGNPDTIGACTIFTFRDGQPVGFVSWNPRQSPTAVIGHNCVRPADQNCGIGAAQLRHVLAILAAKGFSRATVTTGDSDFFAPARRMYASCGSREVHRTPAESGETMGTVDYSLDLSLMFRHEDE